MQPAGWYPDPSGAPGLRWWDGSRWTDQTSSAAGGPPPPGGFGPPGGAGPVPPPAAPTNTMAIAALIVAIVGVPVIGLVLGVIAKRRVARSRGAERGRGLAIAAIWVSIAYLVVYLAVIAVIVIAIVTDESNAERFSGAERPVAQVIDDVESNLKDDDGAFVCNELFTASLAQRVQLGAGKPCATVLTEDEGFQVDITAESIDVTGTRATARVEEGDDMQTWTFVQQGGRWRVDGLEVD